jgi:hypothetical protein
MKLRAILLGGLVGVLMVGLLLGAMDGVVLAGEGEVTPTPLSEEELMAAHVALVEDFLADIFGAGFVVMRDGDEFVKVTVPADEEESLVEETGMDFDPAAVVMMEDHADGSTTVTLTAEYYDAELAEMIRVAENEMAALMNEGVFASVVSYSYSEGMDEFFVVVNGTAFANSAYDAYAALMFGYFGVIYQALDGEAYEDVSVLVEFSDLNSGELVKDYLFPEQFEEFDLNFLAY